MKNIYFILFLFIISSSKCFDDMIAMLPSLRTSGKSFLKKSTNVTNPSQNETNHTNVITNSSLPHQQNFTNFSSYNSSNCEEIEFMAKIDKQIQDFLDTINAAFIEKTVEIEKEYKAAKNVTEKANLKKSLDELINSDLKKIKEIQDVFDGVKKETNDLKNQYCKKQALAKLNDVNDHIRVFMQTMNAVVSKSKTWQ